MAPLDMIARAMRSWTASLLWLFGVELCCLGGFFGLLVLGRTGTAIAILAVPFQALAWLAMLQDRRYLLVGFTALLPLAGMELLPYYYFRYAYYPMTLLLLVVASASRFLVGERAKPRRTSRLDSLPLWLLGAALALSTISTVLHGWANPNFWFHVVLLAQALGFAYFFATVPQTAKDVGNLVLVLGVALVITTLAIPLLPHPVGEGGLLGGKIIVTPFGESNLNVFGTFLSSGSALLLGVALQERRTWARTAMLLGVAVLLVMLVLSKSRGAWLGLSAAIVYLVLSARSARIVIATVAVAVLLLVSDQLRQVLLVRASETSARDPSLLGRLLIWLYVWKVGSQNWLLGVGFDNFRFVKHIYGYPYPLSYAMRYHAHNIFMEAIVDLGIVGFIGFCWTYLRTILRLHRVSRNRSRPGWGLALGLSAALISYGAHGLFDFVAFQHGALLFLSMLLGLGVSFARINLPVGTPRTNAQQSSA
jgi:O-antigen ligase